MGALRRRINRVCHWTGLLLALLPLVLAGYLLVEGRSIVDPDDRNEMIGAALFFSFAGALVYLVARTVGWISAEIVD
jgi:hypothetical protein